MAVYLTDESARAFWNAAESLDGQTSATHAIDLSGARATPGALRECRIPRTAIVGRMAHVLVRDANDRRFSKHVAPHACTARLPIGSFRKVSDSVYVASPEFLFVRMARKLPLAATVRLGFELCGTYIVNPSDPARNNRAPLTTVRKIARFLKHVEGMRGAVKARRALAFVVEGSNSPMETVLTMLLCMPNRHGGHGLPRPVMNHSIKLGQMQARETGRREFKCDLYWKDAAYALEYYGREWHTGAAQVAYDARRQGELQFRGIDITVVTYEQVESPDQVAILARKTAKRLGTRLRKPTATCLQARAELHRYLVGTRVTYAEEREDATYRHPVPDRRLHSPYPMP